jgi:hypothetical protein
MWGVWDIAMNKFLAGIFDGRLFEQGGKKLTATSAGSRFLNSPKYEKAIRELVHHNYELDESFYQLLIGVTASFLCETDPHGEETSIFDKFVTEHMSIIRAAIDRVKVSQPQIGDAEAKWIGANLTVLIRRP